jgi:tripartite-type tricarboxylate transporter receptor subunit TctC
MERSRKRFPSTVMASRRRVLGACAALAVMPAASAAPMRFPERAIRIVVPFPPAGATDLLARRVGDALGRRLGVAVITENRPGAAASVGGEVVARSPADGYTILMAPVTVYAAGLSLSAKRVLDLERDFLPLCTVAYVPHVLLVPASLPPRSVGGLITLARSAPAPLKLASQGVGTISHLEGEMFRAVAGIELIHVPYKGSAPAHVDLIAGRVQVMFDSVAAALPHIRAGRLRALAATTPRRTAALPDVPTAVEAGLPGYVTESWVGALAPARVPGVVAEQLTVALKAVVGDVEFATALAELGLEARVLTGDAFRALIRREITQWSAVVRRLGITLD